MSSPVFVLAMFVAKPGKEKEAEALLKSVVAPTHREPGCLTYALHQRTDQPGTFYFIEKWRHQDDLNQHLKSAHVQAAFVRKDELFTVADIGFIEPLSGGDPAKGLLFK